MAAGMTSQSLALLAVVASQLLLLCTGVQTNWTHWGGDLNNRRFSDHSCLDFKAGGFRPKWKLTTTASVIATPAVCGGAVYFVDATAIYKADLNGGLNWTKTIASLLPNERNIGTRSAPILSPDCKTLYTFTQWSPGAWVIAVDTAAGAKKYATKIDPQPMARTTMSGVLWNGILYIGLSSMAEGVQTGGTTFRGSMLAVRAAAGSVKWRTYMCPNSYTGCGVWGSSPSIDVRRNQVCVGTGNNYEVPANVAQCVKSKGRYDFAGQRACGVSKDNLSDAVVCMNLDTGAIKWAQSVGGVDIWLPGNYMGLDHDFAQGAVLVHKGDRNQDVLIATSKNGMPVAYNPDNGQTKWSKGALSGGAHSMFGSCTNNKVYCVGLFWFDQRPGQVVCMDVVSGATKFQWTSNQQGGVFGPLTCTQNYVFVPLFNGPGSLVALDINRGFEVGRFNTGKTLFCGPAIVKGVAYVGSGYAGNGGVPNNVLHAVQLPMRGTC